ncbi:30S ribosomal protein S16 [Candidatus Gottesmanbacteria bacterium RBG_16_37_8]|uniref:Small ribosomal subunit protein bS16 n=1 Tax=Candidatus Gottesmanbacteria bacterium RBG_16_37_8 TaxID=1798371 RepID=A0A1F5YTV5_9BACT|nr:MAG: 30S ribosomal protein S16 [Candidatus Gottesmanbacteria bacterium RBG_16_37_8]
MATVIKLVRHGRKKRPSYRIVVAEKRSKVTGAVKGTIGFYDPSVNPPKIEVNQNELKKWLSVGSKPTDSVKKLLKL